MSNGNSTTRSRPVNQADRADIPEPSKIGASTSYDFEARNLTAYGGLLPVATVGDYWQNRSNWKRSFLPRREPSILARWMEPGVVRRRTVAALPPTPIR